MVTNRQLSFVTLGWQTWSFVVVVLVIALAGAAYLMLVR
jgi:hypothetical protein